MPPEPPTRAAAPDATSAAADAAPAYAAAPLALSGLGEAGVLARILPLAPTGPAVQLGPGDDAAVITAASGSVVATTDMLVEDRDFRRDWSSAEDVGWKAAAQNLADVAAMGAVPTALLIAIGAPPDTDVAWLEGFTRGVAACCEGTGAALAGGDLSAASSIVVAVTALGDLEGRAPVRRDGAHPGDVLAVAGTLGRSAAGLDLLRAGRLDLAPDLVDAHRRPRPPLAAGPAAARAGATAMLDVSDGLVRDAGRIAAASGVHVDLHDEGEFCAPLLAAARALVAAAGERGGDGADGVELARHWVLAGGEDHGLLATFPPDVPLPAPFVRVGEVLHRREGRPAVTSGGDEDAALVGGGPGWDHFD